VADAAKAVLDAFDQPYIDPAKPAVISDTGEVVTYAEFADRARRVAGLLRSLGLKAGDAVALVAENSPFYLEVLWGTKLAGLYIVAISTNLGPDEVAYILKDSAPDAFIASTRVAVFDKLTEAHVAGVDKRYVYGGPADGWQDIEPALANAPLYEIDTDLEGDLLQYSSGTTGRPKGIKRALRPRPESKGQDTVSFLLGLIGADTDSVYLTPAPLYHSAPHMWTAGVLRAGGTVVLMTKFDAERSLALIDRHKVTHGQFVPTMFVRMLKLPEEVRAKYDVSSLKGVVHAAAPCPIEIKRSMIDWWGPIVSEYWSSSEGAGFAYIGAQDWLEHPGSVGKPMLGGLHICDAEGNELPTGQDGIIWSEMAAFKYLNDPGKDAETTHQQGWRTVGDIGHFDADGYLYLTDRASFMIISGGVNIYPQESENVLIEHPLVMDAAVFGVPDPDRGEVPIGVVQLVEGSTGTPELADELIAWCQQHIAKYKCPWRIEFADKLPRTDMGKLMKRELRNQYAAS
jgi:fatty-acyl-CoA synthase